MTSAKIAIVSYWDTSALVKLYLVEPDSTQFEALALASPLIIGMIVQREIRAVFHRREAEGAIRKDAASALYRRVTADVTSGVLCLQPESDDVELQFGIVLERCFGRTPPIFIRTNDAVHLAAARVAGETEFVTADQRQRAAAEYLGFKLLP